MKTIAVFALPNQHAVSLCRNDETNELDRWHVQYGKQKRVFLSFDYAMLEYHQCCQHAAVCAGLLEIDESPSEEL